MVKGAKPKKFRSMDGYYIKDDGKVLSIRNSEDVFAILWTVNQGRSASVAISHSGPNGFASSILVDNWKFGELLSEMSHRIAQAICDFCRRTGATMVPVIERMEAELMEELKDIIR